MRRQTVITDHYNPKTMFFDTDGINPYNPKNPVMTPPPMSEMDDYYDRNDDSETRPDQDFIDEVKLRMFGYPNKNSTATVFEKNMFWPTQYVIKTECGTVFREVTYKTMRKFAKYHDINITFDDS